MTTATPTSCGKAEHSDAVWCLLDNS